MTYEVAREADLAEVVVEDDIAPVAELADVVDDAAASDNVAFPTNAPLS